MKFRIDFNREHGREKDLEKLGATFEFDGNLMGKRFCYIEIQDFKALGKLTKKIGEVLGLEYSVIISIDGEDDVDPCLFIEKEE